MINPPGGRSSKQRKRKRKNRRKNRRTRVPAWKGSARRHRGTLASRGAGGRGTGDWRLTMQRIRGKDVVRRFGGSVACSDAAEAESGERRAETEGGEWRDVMGQNEQTWTQQRESQGRCSFSRLDWALDPTQADACMALSKALHEAAGHASRLSCIVEPGLCKAVCCCARQSHPVRNKVHFHFHFHFHFGSFFYALAPTALTPTNGVCVWPGKQQRLSQARRHNCPSPLAPRPATCAGLSSLEWSDPGLRLLPRTPQANVIDPFSTRISRDTR